MFNPLMIAAKDKGFLPMVARGRVIANRYGVTSREMEAAMSAFIKPINLHGCSATIPVTASALASNPAAAKKYSQQGLELAVHGLHHVDYSLLDYERQLSDLTQAREIFQRFGIEANGFRSPYLRWNENTLSVLKETGFTYDSSQALELDVAGGLGGDPYRRVLEFYRAQTVQAYPALPRWAGDLIRIPYCLPDDEALVDRLHIQNPGVMAVIWLAMLDQCYQLGELFTLGLHPERAPVCQAALHAVLVKARTLSPGVWIARLDEIAAWYRSLGKATFEIDCEGGDLYYVKVSAPDRATVLVRSSEIIAATEPWNAGYQVVCEREFFFRSGKRPLIGLSPNSPASLQRFLRHQGYLVEINPDSQAYSVYLGRSSFEAQDERPLLGELERGRWPLVRLSRWPEAARCALAVTGDLDAFTIWDFARQILVN